MSHTRHGQTTGSERPKPSKSLATVPPSQRKRPKWVAVPPPLIDVWRVFHHRAGRYELVCFCFDVDQAYAEADKAWSILDYRDRSSVRVDHKGALLVQGKVYLVNILPIKVLDYPKKEDQERMIEREPSCQDTQPSEVSTS